MIIDIPLEFYYKILMEYCNTQNTAYMDSTALQIVMNESIDIPNDIINIMKKKSKY